uniref:Receptor-mediated endocytosis protein 6 homolog n=1 Tax=Culex pipiens TaxID=7175 RepID=A0A8D8BMT4_CULPI
MKLLGHLLSDNFRTFRPTKRHKKKWHALSSKQLNMIFAALSFTIKFDRRCIKSLISLLSMGSDKPVAADDIIPVLIYVIIQTNPPNLLSTIEYVNCFVDEMLQGENQYWWTQFCSAVTFIKTLDYCE